MAPEHVFTIKSRPSFDRGYIRRPCRACDHWRSGILRCTPQVLASQEIEQVLSFLARKADPVMTPIEIDEWLTWIRIRASGLAAAGNEALRSTGCEARALS